MKFNQLSRLTAGVLLISLLFIIPAFSQVNTKSLNKYFAQALTDWQVPGMSVAIVKDGEIVFAKGYGVLETGKKQKADEHTNYAIASNTKAFISASLAHLVWEGKINWDDKVVDYLPYFALYDAYTTQHATIEDLLSHRLGLGTFSGDVIWYKSEYSAEEVIKHIKYVPQAYEFRAGYGYSNLMFITAGEVIKSVTGMSWDTFVEKHFLEKLDMDRTVTSVNALPAMDNIASPHKTINDKITSIPWVNWDNMGAAGGIISNVEDMGKWMIMQMNNGLNGADTLFSPKVQVDMWTPHNNHKVSLASQKNMPSKHFNGYGLGWGLSDYQGRKMVGHGGGYDGMYSKVTMIPDDHLGIVVLTNAMTGVATPITMRAIDEILGTGDRDWSQEALPKAARYTQYKKDRIAKKVSARVEGTAPNHPLEDFAGEYFDPFYGKVTITLEGDNLAMAFAPAPHLNATLSHWHYNTFKIVWNEVHAWFDFGTVQFILDNDNKVSGIEFDVPNYDIFFDEIHLKKE